MKYIHILCFYLFIILTHESTFLNKEINSNKKQIFFNNQKEQTNSIFTANQEKEKINVSNYDNLLNEDESLIQTSDIILNIKNDKINKDLKMSLDINYDKNSSNNIFINKEIIEKNKKTIDSKVIIKNDKNETKLNNSNVIIDESISTIKDKLKNRAKSLVNDQIINCTNNTFLSARSSCLLCNSSISYLLNEDNWFKIGLVNSQHKSYSNFLNTLNSKIPNTTFYISFSDDAICVASQNISKNTNLQDIIEEFSYKSISDYDINNNVFELNSVIDINFFQVKYLLTQNENNYDNFLIKYSCDKKIEINELISIFPKQIEIDSFSNTITTQGELKINDTISFIFHNIYSSLLKIQNFLKLSLHLNNEKSTLENFILQIFGPNYLQSILKTISSSNYIKNIQNMKIKSINYNIYLQESKKGTSFFDIRIFEIPNFAITPEFSFYNCFSDFLLFLPEKILNNSPDDLNWKLIIDCDCHGMEEIGRGYIIKTNSDDKIYLNATKQNITLKLIEKSIFKNGFAGKSFIEINKENFINSIGIFAELKNMNSTDKYKNVIEKLNLENSTIDYFSTEIFIKPQLTYQISGEIYLENFIRGNLNALVTNIGGILNTAVQIEILNVNLEKFLKNLITKNVYNQLIELSEILISKRIIIFTSNQDVDLKNFNYLNLKNFNNDSFWEEGIHLTYEFKFDEAKNCKLNKFCEHMQKINENDYIYSISGDFFIESKVNQSLVLSSKIIKLENFQSSKIVLDIPFYEIDNKYLDGYDSLLINFKIKGIYYLNVEMNTTLKFKTETKYYYNSIVINGFEYHSWNSAFNLTNLNLNQISLQGQINIDNFELESYELTSLAIFGRDCFLETEKERLFQKSRCFYGNSNIKINKEDYQMNHIEGVFKNATIWSVLFNTLDYDTFKQYEKISKYIALIKFTKGVFLIYSNKDHEISSKKKYINNNSSEEEKVIIPKGFTIKGNAQFMGLNGFLAFNIVGQELIGIFNMDAFIFAGGNALILESNLIKKENHIYIKINNEDYNNEDKQITFKGEILVFNERISTNMTIRNDGYYFDCIAKIFHGIYDINLFFKAPYHEDLKKANFNLKGIFPLSFLKELEGKLTNKTNNWIEKIKKIMDQIDKIILKSKNEVKEKKEKLCNKNACSTKYQCSTPPTQQCLMYKEKMICKREELFCLKPEQICLKEELVCIDEKEICIKKDENKNCIEKKKNCENSISLCKEWKHVCNSETVTVCSEFEKIIDATNCIKSAFICKIENIEDIVCKEDCDDKESQFIHYSNMLANLTQAKLVLDRKLVGFYTLNDEIKRNPNFLKVISAKFDQDLKKIINQKQLNIEIAIVSFKDKNLNNLDYFKQKGFDFKNIDKFTHKLFKSLLKRWAKNLKFDISIIKNNKIAWMKSIFFNIDNSESTKIFMQKTLLEK